MSQQVTASDDYWSDGFMGGKRDDINNKVRIAWVTETNIFLLYFIFIYEYLYSYWDMGEDTRRYYGQS